LSSIIENIKDRNLRIALVGNPNSGKSTLFNVLTGLNQKVGNFPGITVEKKIGTTFLSKTNTADIIDLPGSYSLYPKSEDEEITLDILCDRRNPDYPDVTLVVVDASNLKRSLFLFSQIVDLQRPTILVLNMIDIVKKEETDINIKKLSAAFSTPVIAINARKERGIHELKEAILNYSFNANPQFVDTTSYAPELVGIVKKKFNSENDFIAYQLIHNHDFFHALKSEENIYFDELIEKHGFDKRKIQAEEIVTRYKKISGIVAETTSKPAISNVRKSFHQRLDKILTHRIWGYVIFLLVLFLIFQSIFSWSALPMEWIEAGFNELSEFLVKVLPENLLTNLLVNGIIAGLSGIVVFVPQIAFLFAFIAILEDTGYMARVSFIMDKVMRRFGLNGRSVIPLISGVACAVPAIMSARTIPNWKERMTTIMVTPLMSCSARLPVYTLLISLVIPSKMIWGIINLQGLTLMGLYLLGFVAAIGSAWVIKLIVKSREKSYFIMEMPIYRAPRWGSIGLTILEKVKVFVFDAGKVIIAISIILWVLSSFAPGNTFHEIEKKYADVQVTAQDPLEDQEAKIASEKLEASYAGIIGRGIEPVIEPLGFDWKIGIALITSFAAREVFVGTMATIYSVGDQDNTSSIREKMRDEINPKTGLPVFTLASGLSLMIFYAFAMQCMSTIAVVYRETKSIKWPLIQVLYMSALAYISSLLVYQLIV
jgi:ferrous iron transport protein B